MSRERLRPPNPCIAETFDVLPSCGNYDAADDLRKSIEFAYEHIRGRVARGGRGWPEPVVPDTA
jgi:hypothetical protein